MFPHLDDSSQFQSSESSWFLIAFVAFQFKYMWLCIILAGTHILHPASSGQALLVIMCSKGPQKTTIYGVPQKTSLYIVTDGSEHPQTTLKSYTHSQLF